MKIGALARIKMNLMERYPEYSPELIDKIANQMMRNRTSQGVKANALRRYRVKPVKHWQDN